MTAPEGTRGAMRSYVTGFALSLALTFVSYFLVVNHPISGSLLLVAILSFAVLQMIVQVTFFLHLGRGPKPNWNLFFFIATVGIVLVVVGGSIMIINNLHYNMVPADQTQKLANDEGIYQVGGRRTGACQQTYANHKVTIKNAQVSPLHTVAHKCDTLTFINESGSMRDIAFGTHFQHQAYAGETELMVHKGINKTITLSESGTYLFHDHLQPEVAGDFSVSP